MEIDFSDYYNDKLTLSSALIVNKLQWNNVSKLNKSFITQ